MRDVERINPSRQALTEGLNLSAEILKNLELNEIPLANIALKSSRLARLMNDFKFQKIMEYEASGYPSTPKGVPPDVWELGIVAGRVKKEQGKEHNELKEVMYVESISTLEQSLKVSEIALEAARDPDVSVSSANPNQYVSAGVINRDERLGIRRNIVDATEKLANSRRVIYQYALRRHYELKLSGIADDIFIRSRQRVDDKIGKLIPDAVQKFAAIHESLLSENTENWANAVHSCRRILQDLADSLYPASEDDKVIEIDGQAQSIKLGKDNYINRIIAFVKDRNNSDRFQEIVGSHLGYLGDRLDSVFHAAQKGSHGVIITREEADRYVIYTYLLIGDILSLYPEPRATE